MRIREIEEKHMSENGKKGGTIAFVVVAILVVLSLVSAYVLLNQNDENEEELPVIRKASDFTLINQDNESVTLSELQGKTVFMCFIYTRCEMPMMCPRTTQNFRTIQDILSENARKETSLITITFDPDYDTPEKLREYGEAHGANFTSWQFLTGDNESIGKVMGDYNVYYNKTENETYHHTMLAVLIDKDGYVRKEYFGFIWKAETVKADIIEVM
jgi:protein SCO1/2